MLIVLLLHLRKDQNAVQVYENEFVQHVVEEVIYQRLEDNEGVGECERHDKRVEMSQRGVKGHLPFIPLTDPRQIIGVAKVKF